MGVACGMEGIGLTVGGGALGSNLARYFLMVSPGASEQNGVRAELPRSAGELAVRTLVEGAPRQAGCFWAVIAVILWPALQSSTLTFPGPVSGALFFFFNIKNIFPSL